MFIMDDDIKLQDWAFSQRKNLPFSAKIKLSMRRIEEWYEFHDGNVYISFSGGIDSTVLVDLVRKTVGDVPLLFINTGLEYRELTSFARGFQNLEERRPKMNFKEVISTYGYPLISKETASKIKKLTQGNLSGKYRNYLLHGDERGNIGKIAEKWKFLLNAPFLISDQCCHVMKISPFLQYQKETGRFPYIGVTQDESFRRKREYLRTGCNMYNHKSPKSKPLGFWTKSDIVRYVYENKLDYCNVYGDIICKNGIYQTTGAQRTGCVFCCMGVQEEKYPNRFQRLKGDDPQLYDLCMRPQFKNGLGFDYVLNYCGFPH